MTPPRPDVCAGTVAPLRYLDVCSGISAPTVAWQSLGWTCAGYAEIETFPRAVLVERHGATPVDWEHRYRSGSNVVPLFGDFTQIKAHHVGPIDLLVGGTPCQSFSVAGLRGGLDDERGNLALEYLRLADRTRPRWLVWENVPGVLSIDGGQAFGAILGGMGELGYGVAYRVLDAQHFGVPQRRRRVFVVGYLGDWRRAAAVLFERHSLSGHSAPRRQAGTPVAALTSNGVGMCGADDNQAQAGHLIPQGCGGDVAPTLNAAYGSKLGLDNQHIDSGAGLFVAHSLRGEGFDASENGTERETPLVPIAFSAKDHGADAGNLSPTLRAGGFAGSHANGGVMPAVAFQSSQSGVRMVDQHATLDSNNGSRRHNGIVDNYAVRRLTPAECEKLQGFSSGFTAVPYRGKLAADGPRYKALGNSMAVPVVRWLGTRIAATDAPAGAATQKGDTA